MRYTDEYIKLATDTVTYHAETLSSQKTCSNSFSLCLNSLNIYIILLCGDVQLNPEPGSVKGSILTQSFDSSDSHFEKISNHLSILHVNVQGIVPKLDLIRSEADLYDIFDSLRH